MTQMTVAGRSQAIRTRAIKMKKLREAMRGIPKIPCVILMALFVVAIFAPFIAPHNPLQGDPMVSHMPPFWYPDGSFSYPLGTDAIGRDILSRLIFGTRPTLIVSLSTIFLGGLAGTGLGLVSGYYGGWLDTIIMRLTDLMLCLPFVLVALMLAVLVGPSYMNTIIVIGLLLWARYARQVRGEVLSVKEKDFVGLAKLSGASSFRIITRHILPNVANTVIVLATLQVGWVILVEASLSFIGAGIPPPTATWGRMVSDGRGFLVSAWWLSLIPGVAILVTVFSVNWIGDWIRDALDPKLRQV